MVDILLAHSYFLKYDSKQLQKMRPYAPLATLYAASCAARARLLGGAVRRHAGRRRGRVRARARAAPAALGGALRGQLQLPQQDVPEPHARGGLPHERAGARARRDRDRRRARMSATTPSCTSRTACSSRWSARPTTRCSSCSMHLHGIADCRLESEQLDPQSTISNLQSTIFLAWPSPTPTRPAASTARPSARPSGTPTSSRCRPGIWWMSSATARPGRRRTATSA